MRPRFRIELLQTGRNAAQRTSGPGLRLVPAVDADNPQVFAYLREGTGRNYLTVLNFSPKAARFDPKTDLTEAMPLLHNYPAPPIAEKEGPIELRPYEGILYRLA